MLKYPKLSLNFSHTRAKKSAGRYEPFSQFDFEIPFGVASTEAYTLLNFYLGFDIEAGRDVISVDFGVLNLADKAYRDFLDTYKGYAMSPGRNAYIKLTVPFQIF